MKKTSTNSGFTIIELMVAMAVMAFGMLGFFFMQGRAAQGRLAGREMNRATVVAQNRCEILRALDYDNALLTVGSHPTAAEDEDIDDGKVDNQISTKYGNFTYNTTWTVSQTAAHDHSNMKTIIVNTTWQLKDNQKGMQTKSLNLTLLKSEEE